MESTNRYFAPKILWIFYHKVFPWSFSPISNCWSWFILNSYKVPTLKYFSYAKLLSLSKFWSYHPDAETLPKLCKDGVFLYLSKQETHLCLIDRLCWRYLDSQVLTGSLKGPSGYNHGHLGPTSNREGLLVIIEIPCHIWWEEMF